MEKFYLKFVRTHTHKRRLLLDCNKFFFFRNVKISQCLPGGKRLSMTKTLTDAAILAHRSNGAPVSGADSEERRRREDASHDGANARAAAGITSMVMRNCYIEQSHTTSKPIQFVRTFSACSSVPLPLPLPPPPSSPPSTPASPPSSSSASFFFSPCCHLQASSGSCRDEEEEEEEEVGRSEFEIEISGRRKEDGKWERR